MKSNSEKYKWHILILGGSIAVMFCLCLYQRCFSPTLGRDSVNYVSLIQLWHDTGSFSGVLEARPDFWFPPLSLFLAKILTDCGIGAESAAVGLNIFFGCMLPLIMFGIARVVTESTKIALASAALVAVNPVMIELSVEAQRDVPYLFFCGLLIFFFCCAVRHGRWYYWIGAGVAFAFSFLIRYETLELLPVIGIYLLALLIFRKGERLKPILHGGIFLICLVAVLCGLLWVSGTGEYVLEQYRKYYYEKCAVLNSILGGGNE